MEIKAFRYLDVHVAYAVHYFDVVKIGEKSFFLLSEGCKLKTLNQCWVDVGPSSTTLAQHLPNIVLMSRVYWVGTEVLWLECSVW